MSNSIPLPETVLPQAVQTGANNNWVRFPLTAAVPQAGVAGHDGAIWMTMSDGTVGHMDMAGNFSEYILAGTALNEITPNPDGNIYVADYFSANNNYGIAQVQPGGLVTDYVLPTLDYIATPVSGSDGLPSAR